jgi:glycolate oxidase FAD binding subunit
VRSPLGASALTILDPQAASRALDRAAPAGGAVLLALVAGFERAVKRQARDLAEMCPDALSTDIRDPAEGDQAWRRVREFADLTVDPEDAILKLGVPPASSAATMQRMHELARTHDLPVTCLAHAGSGVVYVRVGGFDQPPGRDRLSRLVREGRIAADALHGSLVVERCPIELKSDVDVWGDVGSSFRIMAALKERFDPHGVLNPGRFVGQL